MPYYVIFAGNRLDLTGDRIGGLTAAFLIAPAFANVFWGFIADRYGFRLVFILSLVSWAGATLLVMAGDDFSLFIVAFVVLGAGFGGYQLSANNLVFEFGSDALLLALAGYNHGQGQVRAKLKRLDDPFSDRSYWGLVENGLLPEETALYVTRFVAAAIAGEGGVPSREVLAAAGY